MILIFIILTKSNIYLALQGTSKRQVKKYNLYYIEEVGTIRKGSLNWILHDFTFKFEYLMVRKITLGVPPPPTTMHEKTKISNLFVIGWFRILTPHDSSIAVQHVKLFFVWFKVPFFCSQDSLQPIYLCFVPKSKITR